ncbi:zinc-binding domain-containing protein [Aspergillus karnatakaensis]|uniref:3CxxC-type zinc finger protein n=1 Tax=Aspergillus karnatakaensis TaxID=1810916 RepID=UPI003CCD8A25
MPSHQGRGPRTYSMYPDLHALISSSLESSHPELTFSFHHPDTDMNCTNTYDTNIMGKFLCNNRTCTSSGWSSKKIAITIRMYRDQKYNVRVYHQRCKRCNWVSRPELEEESYVDRVTYRLKKWNGVKGMDQPMHKGESQGPHDRKRCEGCKAGHCMGLR